MEERDSLGFPEERRAQRIICDRPVKVVSPLAKDGRTVNISATGLLIRLTEVEKKMKVGETVTINLIRSDGSAALTIQGKVVRVEPKNGEIHVAIDLV